MKNYQLLSAILSDLWLINEHRAHGYLPLINNLIKGDNDAVIQEIGEHTDKKPSGHIAAVSEDEINPSEEFSYWLHAYHPGTGKNFRLDRYSQAPEGSIAIIKIQNVMTEHDTFCGPAGTKTMSKMVESAYKCNCISGIILEMKTGGGQVSGTELMGNAIKNSTKPIVALGNAMYSAGYWVASASDKIILTEKTGGVGSIGTMIALINMKPFYEKLGYQFIEEYASKSTEKNRAFNELLQGNKQRYVEGTLDPINELFHKTVKSNRPDMNLQDKSILAGGEFMGDKAIDAGLVDMIGTFQDAVRYIQTGQLETQQQPAAAEGSGSGSASGSGSSSAKSNSNQLNNIDMFNNYSAITAIANKQAKGQDITEADIQAVNDQLAAKGVSSFAFVSQSTASEAENTIAGLENTVNNLTALFGDDAKAEKFDLLAAVKKMKEDKEAAEAKVEEYGDQPGDKPTSAKKNDDNPDETMDWVDPEAEHNKIAAEMRSSN